jgi:chromosome segregation ATPase
MNPDRAAEKVALEKSEQGESEIRRLTSAREEEGKRARELEAALRAAEDAASVLKDREHEQTAARAQEVGDLQAALRDLEERLAAETRAAEKEAARAKEAERELELERERGLNFDEERNGLLAAKEEECARAQAEAADAEDKREQASRRVRELEDVLQERRETEKATLRAAEQEHELILADVRGERDALERRLREVEALLQRRGEAEKEVVRVMERESALKEELGTLQRMNAEETRRAREGEVEVERGRERARELQGEIERLKAGVEEQIAKKEGELADARRKVQDLEGKLSAAEGACREEQELAKALQGAVDDLRATMERGTAEVEGEREREREEAAARAQEVSDLHAALRDLEERLAAERNGLLAADKAKEEKEEELARARAETVEMRGKLERALDGREHERRVRELEAELQTVKGELAEARSTPIPAQQQGPAREADSHEGPEGAEAPASLEMLRATSRAVEAEGDVAGAGAAGDQGDGKQRRNSESDSEPDDEAPANRTTIGVMLLENQIDNMVVSHPFPCSPSFPLLSVALHA